MNMIKHTVRWCFELRHHAWLFFHCSPRGRLPGKVLRPNGALRFFLGVFLIGLHGLVCNDTFAAGDATSKCLVLFEDECRSECIQAIQDQADVGVQGSVGLRLTPDLWHRPVYRLYCGGGMRTDFAAHDVIRFHFRSPAGDPGEPTFCVSNWEHTSNIVFISDYIDGAVIDQTWRRVTIPIRDLATEAWDLGNVESLKWNKDSSKRTYYADNIFLETVNPPALMTARDKAPFPESNTVLRLTFSKRYDPKSAKALANYTLMSSNDPSYADPKKPLDSGIQYRLTGFTESKRPINCYQVFLKFPAPFKNGHTYILNVKDVADPAGNAMKPVSYAFIYDDTRLLNPNIKVNQIGYLPDRPKIGYVGGYLGDLGGGAWAVGEEGALFSWDDQEGWVETVGPVSTCLHGVAAIREDRVWAVGDAGTIIHWDGCQWERLESPTSEDLLAICFGPTNIGWAVGKSGTALRMAESGWVRVDTPTQQTLRSVWAGPGDTAWAVGDWGTILCWDGLKWHLDEQPTSGDLYAVHGPHEDWLWACGTDGKVLLHRYGHWQIFSDVPGTSKTLRSLTSDENGAVWIGGDDGILWHKPGFGSSPFVSKDPGTTGAIYALARQNGRQFWGVGEWGLVIRRTTGEWCACAELGFGDLNGIFALGAGPLRLSDPPPEAIVEDVDTGQAAFRVSLNLRAANWSLSGEDLYSFDFSGLNTPGTYQIHIPGIGLSTPFVVDKDVLNHAAYTAARGLYYQRSGAALTAPYAEERFARPSSHEYDPGGRRIDAAFHDSLIDTPLYAGEIPGDMLDAHGGWHDAGDYGKYMPTAAAALWFLFTAYDLDPAKFRDGTLNIPESGNGVPDLLDEARWEVDWMARIQANDGGVYHKLTAETWFKGMPHEENMPRFLFEKTTHDTALAAAVFASASRLWRPFDPSLAALFLERAERAWQFLKTHAKDSPSGGFRNPAGTVTGEYNDPEDMDNRLWAAAELYRTTEKDEYRGYFEHWWGENEHPSGWNKWRHFYGPAYWAYLRADHDQANPDIKEAIRKRILKHADQLVSLTRQNPYHNGARLDVPDWIGWGAFSQGSEYAFPLLQAWAVNPEQKYLDAATLNLDTQLGVNPLSFSFITGLGVRCPQDPLHKISLYDGVTEPVPGIPVFGVFAHMSNGQPFYLEAQKDENSYPCSYATTDPYPILRRYVDAHQLVPMSEFTIVDMAIAAGVLHLLAGTPIKSD